MTPVSKEHIVIVGGGTAGWLAALMLGDPAVHPDGQVPKITVIESSQIGTIGVGEGTTAVFRQMLKHFDLDEAAFLSQTRATIKYGIRHRDWRRSGHHYDGPIDDVNHSLPGAETYALARGKSVAEPHLFTKLMDRGRAPFGIKSGRQVAASQHHHAYHFDQALTGQWLRKQVTARTPRLQVIDGIVEGVVQDGETGQIRALRLAGGQQVQGDFFVDCTGFRRALIGQLGVAWHSYRDDLPVNRALPFWLDLKPDAEIPPYTLAWAQKNGWMWQIPTADRMGCGYVFSDDHCTAEQAKAEVEQALAHPVDIRRDIAIEAGRLDQAWRHNCVALGLSSSFLEPLEATSIHGTIVQLMLLTRLRNEPNGAAQYNRIVARQVDDFKDFIRLHYVSERRDSTFWQDVTAGHPPDLLARIAAWRDTLPKRSDFVPFPGDLPHVQDQLYTPVLDGLGLLSRAAAKAALDTQPKRRAQLRKAYDLLTKDHRKVAAQCLPHRAWLRSLSQETVK